MLDIIFHKYVFPKNVFSMITTVVYMLYFFEKVLGNFKKKRSESVELYDFENPANAFECNNLLF